MAPTPAADDTIGVSGEKLTRAEALDLVQRAVTALVSGEASTTSEAVRRKAFELLGRDSETLAARMFERILRDAHDADVIDLRRRGDSYEVGRVAEAASIADQIAVKEAQLAKEQKAAAVAAGQVAPSGLATRGRAPARSGGRSAGGPPPNLLMVGVVGASAGAAAAPTSAPAAPTAAVTEAPSLAPEAVPSAPAAPATSVPSSGRGGRGGKRKPAAKVAEAPAKAAEPATSAPAKAAPAKAAPAKAAPAKAAPAKAAPAKAARPAKAAGKSGATKAPAKSAPAKSAPAKSGAVKAAPVKAAKADDVKPAKKAAAKVPAKKSAKKAK